MIPSDSSDPPKALTRLLSCQGPERDAAWTEFVASHSRLLLHVCRTLARDSDGAMDGYAHVLEVLRKDDHRRLRAYVPDGRTRFTTWLVVVTRRALLDRQRSRYGRPRSETDRADHHSRRQLEDLVAAEIDPDELSSDPRSSPDALIRHRQLTDQLRDAMVTLAPADRLLLALRFQDGHPVKEIATMLKMPSVFHVYRRLSAVLGSLKSELAKHGVEDAEP
jgi:RNA polymerase sigma factor (sigma-70 family)